MGRGLSSLRGPVSGFFTRLRTGFGLMMTTIRTGFGTAMTAVRTGLTRVAGMARTSFATMAGGIRTAATMGFSALRSGFGLFVRSASAGLRALATQGRAVGGMALRGMAGVGGKAIGGIGMGLAAAQMAGLVPAPGKGAGGAVGSVAMGASMGMMFGPWGAGIGAAAGGLKALYDNVKPFHKLVNQIGQTLVKWGKDIWKKVGPDVKKFFGDMKQGWHDIQPFVKRLGEFMKMYVVGEIKAVIWLIKHLVQWWKILWSVGKTVAHGLATAFVRVVNAVTHIINAVIHGVNAIIRGYNLIPGHKDIKTIETFGTMKVPKFHSGGIVPGKRGTEVPAILQAGEAVMSLRQMNALRGGGGGGSLNVQSGAVTINVHGNADPATTAEIKRHVEAQFKELHRTLKGMGR